ncbi:MAG: peptidoglycan-binding domain-containing protein [Patescibacteria group bacterium]
MKKFLIASGVAVLAFASVASAQGYSFNSNLTVGSTGPDVVALQTWLINNNFSIPSIASGAAAKGYFGSQTKAAVMAYQASRGIPNTGFVGPLTRGALNGGGVASNPGVPVCPPGYNCTPVNGTTPPPVTTTPGMITTPGVAGTISLSLQSTPSNGTSVDKGQSADVVRYKLQAGASDQQITSLSIDFDVRLWLYASAITIKDDSGAVVASKSGLSQADFTELTVGTQYRLYVPLNYVVPRSGTKYFTVNVTMLGITDRCPLGNCTIGILQAQVRSVDGTGVTDTQTSDTVSNAADRTFTFTGSNNGQIVVTVDASSPLKRLVNISTSAETPDVVLGIVDLKSQNRSGNLRALNVYIRTNGTAVATLFNDIKIKAGSLVYSMSSLNTSTLGNTTSSSTAVFTDLNIPLAADQYVPITILGKVAKDTSNALDGASASTTVLANATNVNVEDSTYNTVPVNSGTFAGSDVVVSASSAVLSNLTAVLGSPITTNQTTTGYSVTMSFVVTAGDNTLFIAANPAVALATTSSGFGVAASSTLSDVTANPGQIAGDTAQNSLTGYYVVPAGSSRQFTYTGAVNNTNGTAGVKTFRVTAVNYYTTAANATAMTGTSSINYNLDALKVAPAF